MAWSATFAPEVGSPGRARGWLDDALAGSAVGVSVRSDALLVASELAGNAVRHARTEFTITAALEGATLRIEVFDRDTRPPSLLGLDDESTSGRGLHLVAAVAEDWGWHTADDADGVSGKVVWAELNTDPPGAPE
jgi:anti-sigma regulatory factor (Ser/Thr protein kinase)